MVDTLSEALIWNSLGIATIPIRNSSKRPALDSWRVFQDRLPTPRELRTWFFSNRYNIAAVTGWRGLVVVDFDDSWRYSTWLSRLPNTQALTVLSTYRVQTRRGWHLSFYSRPPATSWRGEGVDVKAAGGYVLAPPSIHPTGHVYRGVGRPAEIQHISSVSELLPEYRDEPDIARGSMTRSKKDPFAEAMCDSVGISVAEIKARLSFEDVLGVSLNGQSRHGVTLIKCPFHDEEQASFAIYPDGHAHCFGACSFHGDVIDFWAAMHNLTIAEAMRTLA